MARLIDADAFGMYLADVQLANRGWKDDFFGLLDDVMDALNDFQEVDAVDVVRCRDCVVPHNKYTGCPKLNGLVTPPDFYCQYGERRSDG